MCCPPRSQDSDTRKNQNRARSEKPTPSYFNADWQRFMHVQSNMSIHANCPLEVDAQTGLGLWVRLFHPLNLFEQLLLITGYRLSSLRVISLVRTPYEVAANVNLRARNFFSIGVLQHQVTGYSAAPCAKANQHSFGCTSRSKFIKNNMCPNWGVLRDLDVGHAKSIFQAVLNQVWRGWFFDFLRIGHDGRVDLNRLHIPERGRSWGCGALGLNAASRQR